MRQLETPKHETPEWMAREVLILEVLAGFGSAQGMAQDGVDALVDVVMPYSIEALRDACYEFKNGLVPGQSKQFPPSAPELVSRVRFTDEVLEIGRRRQRGLARKGFKVVTYPLGGQPPEGFYPIGPLEVHYGNGPTINMRDMSPGEKDEVLRRIGLPPPPERKALTDETATDG